MRARRALVSAVVLAALLMGGCGGGGGVGNRPPTIAGLNPSATSVEPSGAVTFNASASDPDGDALTYTWSASGGTFDSTTIRNPTWTAPATIGLYAISLEVSDGHGRTATRNVTITVSQGTTGEYLFYENFESGLGAWFDHEYPQRMYTTNATAYTGSHCLEMAFRPGDGEVGPGWMYRRFFPERAGTPLETEGVEEVYMRVFQRWSANWQWPQGGDGPHNLYLLAGDVDGLATTELTVYLEIRNLHPLAVICGAHQNINYQDWEATAATPIQLDRWYCLEIRAKMNDPGQANGIIQVWLDNQQVLDVGNITMRHNRIGLDGTTLSFHEMAIGPWYHDGIYNQQPMYIWMDELAVSTQRIGMATLTAGTSDAQGRGPR